MNENKYNVLDSVLQKITSKCIRFSEKEKKIYNDHLKQVLNCILKEMKKDYLFNFLYQNVVYTGSSYENLRIAKPDEFDINLVFKLHGQCKLVYDKRQPGFIKLKLISLNEFKPKREINGLHELKSFLSWFNNSGYLLRTNFMQWMHGVFDKALNNVSLKDAKIKRSSSGPAFTIQVSQPKLGFLEYSVDLVPVFEFSEKDWPSTPVRKLPKGVIQKAWSAVPKAPLNNDDACFWRMSFYQQEREIMKDMNGMKHIIKLIKLFREHRKWKVLSSYAIKTIFLWEIEKESKNLWRISIGQLFIHMLRKLLEYLKQESIPFYWDKNHNLLSKARTETLSIMSNHLAAVLKQIDRNLNNDPQFIKKYFGC